MIDRLRRRTERSAVWLALVAAVGALLMSIVVFALTDLTGDVISYQ